MPAFELKNNLQPFNNDDFKSQAVNVNNQVNRVLPSASISYNFTEKMLARTAYGRNPQSS